MDIKEKIVYSNLDYLSLNLYSMESDFAYLYKLYNNFLVSNDISSHLYDDNYIPISEIYPSLPSCKSIFFKFYIGKYPYKFRILLFYKFKNKFYLFSTLYFSDDFNESKKLKLINQDISFAGNIFLELKGQYFYLDKFLKYKLTEFLGSFLDLYTYKSISYVKYNRIDYCFDFLVFDRNEFNFKTFEFFERNVLLKNRLTDYHINENKKTFVGYMLGSKQHQYFSIVSYFKTERNLLYTSYLMSKNISLRDVQRIEFRMFKDVFRKRKITNVSHFISLYENIYVISLDLLHNLKEFKDFISVLDFHFECEFDCSNLNHFVQKQVQINESKEWKRIMSSIASYLVKYDKKVRYFLSKFLNEICSENSYLRQAISYKRKKMYKSFVEMYVQFEEKEVDFL